MAIPLRWPRLTTHSPVSLVIAHAPFGVARISPEMRFEAVNPRLGALLGAEPRDLVGTEVADVLLPDDRVPVIRGLRAILSGSHDEAAFELETPRPDRTSGWLRWSVTASRRSDGTLECLVVAVEDATAAHKADSAAAEHLAALERLTYLINGFAAMVSHETRTALTGIQGMSELILEGESDPSALREFAGCIFQEAERINRLLEEMLDLNRMQTRPSRLRKEPVDLNRLAVQAVERIRPAAAGHPIGLDLAERLPTVVGDPERLSQVIENLIRFAARCSIKGGRLDVCSAQRETAVVVFIRYVGNGQSIDFDNWLYGRYEPYENNPSIITGVGLGLAIARVIVERHAGEIWMESASLNSCELCFAIPARQAPAPAAI